MISFLPGIKKVEVGINVDQWLASKSIVYRLNNTTSEPTQGAHSEWSQGLPAPTSHLLSLKLSIRYIHICAMAS